MNIISLGLGVQSTALYFMSCMGLLPRADYAVFSDPGMERQQTYLYLQFLLRWAADNNGIPIIVITKKNLYADLTSGINSTGQRFASIPAFFKNKEGATGMGRRQCTMEYKIRLVDDCIRDLYHLKKGQRRPVTYVWKGITLDEMERMSEPVQKWKRHVYPFTGYQFNEVGNWEKLLWGLPYSRSGLYGWYEQHHLPVPPKSSCVCCPYMPDSAWIKMKKENGADWQMAVRVDHAIRERRDKKILGQSYLHRSLKPLEEVVFDESDELWAGECSGNCHL